MKSKTRKAAGKASVHPLVGKCIRRLETVSYRLRHSQRGLKWTCRAHDADIIDMEVVPALRQLTGANLHDNDDDAALTGGGNAVPSNGVVGGPVVTCRGCAGQFDDAECRHPHSDKRACWHASKHPANMLSVSGERKETDDHK